jgi:hypothetical protein
VSLGPAKRNQPQRPERCEHCKKDAP